MTASMDTPFIDALLDDPLLTLSGFPKLGPFMRWVVSDVLRPGAHLPRLLPQRRRPILRTGPRTPTYPRGYPIEQLGPDIDSPGAKANPVASEYLARPPQAASAAALTSSEAA
jgi:hypothetical protein